MCVCGGVRTSERGGENKKRVCVCGGDENKKCVCVCGGGRKRNVCMWG